MKRFLITLTIAGLSGWILAGCGSAGEDCTPRAQTLCEEGILYWVDSCGNQEDVQEHCRCGCREDRGDCAWCTDLLSVLEFEGRILPGEFIAVHYDSSARLFGVIDPCDNMLFGAAAEALDLVPGWLRDDLRNQLTGLEEDLQEEYGTLITQAADAHLIDEIAYVIAHASAADLRLDDSPEVISNNAVALYAIASDLTFAELVEHGQPGDEDHYTTVRHSVLVDGSPETYEVPREIYYRYVVFPVIDVENIQLTDPRTDSAAAAPAGVFWRDYLYNGGDQAGNYLQPGCLKQPNQIDDTYLAAADFGAAAAYGTFTGLEVGPIEIMRADGGDDPVTIMFVRGDGRCCNDSWPNPDGIYLATLVPVEAAAANGSPELLENLLAAGHANGSLGLNTLTAVEDLWNCLFTEEPRRVLILRDRIPFGLAADPNETALQSLGYDYEVLSSADLPGLVLSATDPGHFNLDYAKIVIPSGQPLAFYQAIADATDRLEAFVDYGGVLQMHLATGEADDWTGLRMPGGIRATPQNPADYIAAVRVYGFPPLRDVLAEASQMWDSLSWPKLSGDRVFDPAESAIARIGWWGGQNTPWRIAEIIAWKRCRGIERSWYPQRIAYNKYGNCGELADLMTAAARAALIPAKAVGTPNEDHIWGEFYTLDRWHPWQDDYSDGGTRIDTWTVAQDADTGGHKAVTALTGHRGDGYIEHLLGRYPAEEIDAEGHITGDYSRYVTLGVRVADAENTPIDGARVLFASESFFDPESIVVIGWAYTDADGRVRVNMGEGSNYYININSPLGELPDTNTVSLIAAEDETLPGEIFSTEVAYETAIETPTATLGTFSDPPEDDVIDLHIDLDVPRELTHGQSLYGQPGKTFTEPTGQKGQVDIYLLDQQNYDLLVAGENFQAAEIHPAVDMLSHSFTIPDPNIDWYLVLSNLPKLSNDQETHLNATLTDLTGR